MEMPYPHWNETTQSNHTMVASSVQSNSVNRSENTIPTIDPAHCNSGCDDTKPDLTRLLSDTSQAEENIESNNDNNEWIDVGHLQNFQPDDVARLQKNEMNKNAEKIVHNVSNSPSHINHENTQSYQKNILEAILLTNSGRTDTDKGINETEAVLKQDEKELTVINIDDSEDEIIDKDSAEIQNNLNIHRKENVSKGKSNKDSISQFSENSKETIPATEGRILCTTLHTKRVKADTIKKRSTNEEQPLQEEKQTRNVLVCTENTETATPKERSVLRAILLRPVLKVEQYKIENEKHSVINRNSDILLNNLDAKRPRLHREIVEVLTSTETPSKYYRCNVCRYTTTSAFYFQGHLKGELHIIAVQQYKMGVINAPDIKFKTYSRKVKKKPDEERSWTKKISKLNLRAQQYELCLAGKQNQIRLSRGKEEEEQATTIVIEDSDKEDEGVVEEKIEVEENVLKPGVECEISNTSAMNNDIFKQQIFTCQLFKCMMCNYSTELINHFENHLHSVRHKWALQEKKSGNSKSTNSIEKTTRNVPKVISQHVMESNSKVLEMNPTVKRKVPREVTTELIGKKQKQITPAKRKPTTTITIEDSDKDDDVQEKIEVKENKLQHKVPAKNSGHLTQPTSPNWYWCSTCRYTTTIKSCFQDHFLSAVHKDADLEKQNTTNTIDIEDNVEDDTTSSAQTRSALQWYWCNVCHYTTTKQRHFKSHFDSTRHQYSVNNKSGCIANKTRKPQIMLGKKTSQSTISEATHSKGKWFDRFVIRPHTEKKKGETSSDKQSQTQTIIVEDSDNEDDNALFKCDLCNCATRKKNTFQTHLQSETHQRAVSKKQGIDDCTLVEVQTQRWYRCEICHYKTRRKKSIDSHFQSKYHIDSVLAAATTSSKHLPNEIEDIQVAKETNFAPPKEYNCSCCTYATQSITDLKVHTVAKHTLRGRSQWYCCDMCNFKTRDRYSFKAHLECQKHQDTMCAVRGGEEDDLIVDEVIEDMEEKEEDDEEVAKSNQPANSIDWTETEVIVKEEEGECTQINYTTESDFLELHESRQEYGNAGEAKTKRMGTLDCEDWAEINVEEDTNECEDYIQCED